MSQIPSLDQVIYLNDHFKRSVNIASDHGDMESIANFYCPATSEMALLTMIRQITEIGEASFTWTGPYGSGKSSLALLLKALTDSNNAMRSYALAKISTTNRKKVSDFFDADGWQIISLVGSQTDIELVFKEAFNVKPHTSPDMLLSAIKKQAESSDRGLIIIIDELGKLLEYQAHEFKDIYFLQQLAEIANRSGGKLIFIGILHQAFSEYARHLTKATRDEWSKIQGRFIDIPINLASEEQIELISKAIQTNKKPTHITVEASITAKVVAQNRRTDSSLLAEKLTQTWPLHPATSILLSELSKKRFGQNQRSIFSFLMSAEPNGFRDFLHNTPSNSETLFTPNMLWDYLATNLESTIAFSSDARIWATAADAIAKCDASHDKHLHAQVLKAIAAITLLKGRSGIEATESLLQIIFNQDITAILGDLVSWSFILFKKHTNGYSLFEGSDFDIDEKLQTAFKQVVKNDVAKIDSFANLKPIIAKRHYHQTGALRWLRVTFQSVPSDLSELISDTPVNVSELGKIICLLPQTLEEYKQAHHLQKNLLETGADNLVVGIAHNYREISDIALELNALEWISDHEPSLSGDSIARREVESRINYLTKALENALYRSLSENRWTFLNQKQKLAFSKLSEVASLIADHIFNCAPKIHNEMLNRDKPSGNANAAMRALMNAMIKSPEKENLAIEGFPPERGLYEAILKKTRIHDLSPTWGFYEPNSTCEPHLNNLWHATNRYLKEKSGITNILDIYKQCWSLPPFGIKRGLFQPLLLSYILSNRDSIALYIEEKYFTEINDYFIDFFYGTPKHVGIQRIDRNQRNDELFTQILVAVSKHQPQTTDLQTPLGLSKALVKTIRSQPKWLHRTKSLSKEAIQLREIVNVANDPNKLLFEDIPNLITSSKTINLSDLLDEIVQAYPNLLTRIGQHILEELQVHLASEAAFEQIRHRAKRIQGKTGDFRVDALASRLFNFDGSVDSISGIASLAANKPITDWIDQDVQRAIKEISALTHEFNKAELLIKVDGVPTEREAISLLFKSANSQEVINTDIEVSASEKDVISLAANTMLDQLQIKFKDSRLQQAVIAQMLKQLL